MNITELIGNIPYRMALAGGWIDQPFVSRPVDGDENGSAICDVGAFEYQTPY